MRVRGRARRIEKQESEEERGMERTAERDQGMCLTWVLSGELETHKTEATVTGDCVAEID